MFLEQKNRRESNVIEADVKTYFTKFLQDASREIKTDQGTFYQPYSDVIKNLVRDSFSHTLIVHHQDFINFDHTMALIVFQSYYKFEPILNETLTQLIKQIQNVEDNRENADRGEFRQKYYVTFNCGSEGLNGVVDIRDLKSYKLGKLTCMRGTVTKTTEVRPELIGGVFLCKFCSRFSKNIEQQFKYTQPKKCSGQNCDSKFWELNIARSDFADFQKIRIQEDPGKIPPGAMPRSIDVVIRDQNVEKAQPGDICKFVGYLCVQPDISSMLKPGEKTTLNTRSIQTRGNMMEMQGVKGLKGIRELNYRFMFICTNVIVQNNQFNNEFGDDFDEKEDEVLEEEGYEFQNQSHKPIYDYRKIIDKEFGHLSQSQAQTLSNMSQNTNLYDDLSESLFPGIFGHSQIKKSLLLQLFSGIHKVTTRNRINIRGDINILIVGDPATAKSQFLKCVNKFVPRSVYTNGKTTSAAGLTATITRDQNGNVSIEAGALMLADNGICCIDEFDKMNLSDQTAIHEAMQQQTISIAKAGVHATLNARTSVLAAANPLFGRYDKSKNLKQNINISPPIMSRFDLFFVVCDESNDAVDSKLCNFLINMHREKQKAVERRYDSKTIRMYISTARRINPRLTLEAAMRLRQCYKILRAGDQTFGGVSYRVTVRQLESMIRLSEAFARMHLTLSITKDHVNEAFRLLSSSILKLQKADIQLEDDQFMKENNQNYENIAMEELQKKKKQEKKQKQQSISYEAYKGYVNDIMMLFQKQKDDQNKNSNDIELSEQNVINYIIAKEFQTLKTEAEITSFKKILRAVIKKMVNEERMLIYASNEEDQMSDQGRILQLHPNHQF